MNRDQIIAEFMPFMPEMVGYMADEILNSPDPQAAFVEHMTELKTLLAEEAAKRTAEKLAEQETSLG